MDRIWQPTGALLLGVGIVLATGCGGNAPEKPSDAAASPQELLNQMIAAYQAASEYHDNARLVIRSTSAGKPIVATAPLSVTFARPGSLRANIYNAEVTVDDGELNAYLTDAATNNYFDQQLVLEVGSVVQVESLFKDPVLANALQSGRVGLPPQLELLLGADPLAALLKDAQLERLPDKTLAKQPCHRVQITRADVKLVCWIDPQSYLLRQVEFPPDVSSRDVGTRPVQYAILFEAAEFSLPAETSGESFWALSQTGTKVDRFIPPPPSLPTKLVGEVIRDVQFDAVTGEPLTDKQFTGRTTLLAWLEPGEDSLGFLSQLDEVAKQFSEQIDTYVVSTSFEPAALELLKRLKQEASFTFDVLVDNRTLGRKKFDVKTSPTIVVIGADGRLQLFDEVVGPRVLKDLPVALERLLGGFDIAEAALYRQKVAQLRFERDLLAASGVDSEKLSPPADALQPLQFSLKKLWHANVQAPSDLISVPATKEEPAKLVALSGSQTVVELGLAGEALATKRLDLPAGEGLSYLRAAQVKTESPNEGKPATGNPAVKNVYLGFRLFGGAGYFFDAAWKTTSQYPRNITAERTLRDVALSDLDGDGVPEAYFGFEDRLGVHATNLQGEPIWTYRKHPAVHSLTVTEASLVGHRKLLVTGNQGDVSQVNHYGNGEPVRLTVASDVPVFGGKVSNLYSLPDQSAYCGLGTTGAGELLAVGFNREFSSSWLLSLKEVNFQSEVPPVNQVTLFENQVHWLLIRGDGMLSLVDGSGDFADHFSFGKRVQGVASRYDSKQGGTLYVSTSEGVTAYSVSPLEDE